MVIMANIPSLERKLIKSELKQRSEEGCDTHEISERVTTALLRRDNNEELHELYEELMALPIVPASLMVIHGITNTSRFSAKL